MSMSNTEKTVKDIRRKTRRKFSTEEKIRIVLDGLRGESSVAELCRQEGISQGIYYKWSKDFMEAGKKRLAGDTARAATTDEVRDLRREARDLKEVVAEQTLELRLLKKSMLGDGDNQEWGILHLRSWRLLILWKALISLPGRRWRSWVLRARPSTVGMIVICNEVTRD